MDDFQRQLLEDYRLTTVEILYHMPDHPALLQSYIWQNLDIAPGFPNLARFLRFWEHNLEGKMHSVEVAHVEVIKPAEFQAYDISFRLQ